MKTLKKILEKIFDKKLIGLIVGIVFLVLILKDTDIHKVIEAVKHLNLFYLVLMIPVYFSSFIFRSLRWKTILSQNKTIRFSYLFDSLLRGWFINCVVPARGGELYRAYYLGKKENMSKVTILASIVLERIFDGMVLFLILLSMVSFVYASKKFFMVSIIAGSIFIGGFAVLLLIAKAYKNTVIQTFIQEKCGKYFTSGSFFQRLFNKMTCMTVSFINGLEIFNSPVLILKSFIYTVFVWLCEGITLLLLIKGFGYSIGISGAMFVLSVVAFASLIPGGPGGLGPVQGGYVVSLAVFKISLDTAVAISIINQLFIIVIVSLGSLFFIAAEYFKKPELTEIFCDKIE